MDKELLIIWVIMLLMAGLTVFALWNSWEPYEILTGAGSTIY